MFKDDLLYLTWAEFKKEYQRNPSEEQCNQIKEYLKLKGDLIPCAFVLNQWQIIHILTYMS